MITTTNTLDHETQDQHVLIVQACDGGAGPLCDTATVVVNVGDFNDEVPQFDIAAYTVDTCETAQRDDAMVQPVATDRDSGSNSDIIYSLEVSVMLVNVSIVNYCLSFCLGYYG